MTTANDSPDLEALFDSIVANADALAATVSESPMPTPAKALETVSRPNQSGGSDSDELQDLFDSIASQQTTDIVGEVPEEWPKQEVVFNQIGQMARALHDTLGQLGYDKLIEKTVTALPDAKDRLAYVANLTEQAACRVLNATDMIVADSDNLLSRWDLVFSNKMTVSDFRQLAIDTRGYLRNSIPSKTGIVHSQLSEIMMAQDFQDLTGQVIKKIVSLAQELEGSLMKVLLEVVPETKRTEEVESLMNGPVINAEGRADVVVNQEQVDDLLESLGF